MSFVKSISLNEDAQAIWKRRFGKHSQEFSPWVCQKLKEEELNSLDAETRKKLIQKKKEKTLAELSKLEEAEKNANIEIESEEKQNVGRAIQKQKDLDESKKKRAEQEEKRYKKSLEIHKTLAISLFEISDEEAERACKEYLMDKKEGSNPGSFKKYLEEKGSEVKNVRKDEKRILEIKGDENEI